MVKINILTCHLVFDRGKLLYLEFLPEDILSQAPLSESDSNNTVVTAELEHQVEATTDLDVDPDRVEVSSF